MKKKPSTLKSLLEWLGIETKDSKTGAKLTLTAIAKRELQKNYWKPMAVSVFLSLLVVGIALTAPSINIAVIITLIFFAISMPIAVYLYFKQERIESYEEQFPNFLRDIAEFKRSGMPLNRAIQSTTKNDYGKLSMEVRKIALELSWGIPFQKSLEKFAKRTGSHVINRAVSIIVEAQESGGEVTSVLETVAADLRKLKEIEKERKSKLSVYTITIYAIYLLLLLIIIMLMFSFVPQVPKIQASGKFLGGSTGGGITEYEFRTLLFHVTLIEAFFAGLISGDMGEGRITAGIKHSIVLVLITVLAFQLVPPTPAINKMAESVLEMPHTKGASAESYETMTYLASSFDNKMLAQKVRELAKERDYPTHKDVRAEEIEFFAVPGQCIPCTEGKITVSADKVKVAESTSVKYKVRFTGEKYRIEFTTAEGE
ncbi:MAG: type II secretion system F family protein [Candidatus Diapherotrites archaeon]|nr:type II secretion system F family protein [Candidatus Diapherotrites archaeon]